jgi:hypothetical protein
MMKMILGAAAVALFSASTLGSVTPAAAANGNFQQQDRYIGNYCDRNPNAGQCNDWQSNHGHWNNNQYQSFYRSHRHDRGFGDSSIAALFGFAAGAAIAGAVNNGGDDGHVRACQSRYRSYDVRSDSFMGYDGLRHACML